MSSESVPRSRRITVRLVPLVLLRNICGITKLMPQFGVPSNYGSHLGWYETRRTHGERWGPCVDVGPFSVLLFPGVRYCRFLLTVKWNVKLMWSKLWYGSEVFLPLHLLIFSSIRMW